MNKSTTNVQDMFLNYVRKEKITVTINLLNGNKITGTIKGFDNFAIFIRHSGQELVYKHAVSTIVPQKDLSQFKDLEFKNKIDLEKVETENKGGK